MPRLDSFLRLVAEQKASDLHLHAGNPPIIRHNGDMMPLPFRVLSETETQRFVYEILNDQQKKEFERDQGLDLIYELEGSGRFRTNVFVQSHGVGAVFRIIPNALPTADTLNFPQSVRNLAKLNNGLVLVTGPTGSGKTTTLAALLHQINAHNEYHIITIEDPIEFVHQPLRSVVTQRQVGEHTDCFANALRSALRESPDVLVVGELRDYETISLAMSAAETGILVFGTLHTNSAAKAITRIIDIMPDKTRDQARGILSVHLRAVVAQELCKRSTGDGRVAAIEILLQSYGVSNMIRENKIHQIEGYLQSLNFEETGMQSMDNCLFRLVKEGMVELEEALKMADYPETLKERIAQIDDQA